MKGPMGPFILSLSHGKTAKPWPSVLNGRSFEILILNPTPRAPCRCEARLWCFDAALAY